METNLEYRLSRLEQKNRILSLTLAGLLGLFTLIGASASDRSDTVRCHWHSTTKRMAA